MVRCLPELGDFTQPMKALAEIGLKRLWERWQHTGARFAGSALRFIALRNWEVELLAFMPDTIVGLSDIL